MSYRPITDVWLLTRAKLKDGRKYYGAYLGGFPERARRLIGCSINEPLLHVCGGMAKYYPYAGGFGIRDKTLDIDPATEPDILQDAECPIPSNASGPLSQENTAWGGILIDPPYSEPDALHYACKTYPNPNKLVVNALAALPVGRKVGIIHYSVPRCPKDAKFIALIGIACGFNNRMRAFSVFEKLTPTPAQHEK